MANGDNCPYCPKPKKRRRRKFEPIRVSVPTWILLVVLPSLALAQLGASSPKNPWGFGVNFLLSLSIVAMLSFMFLDTKGKPASSDLPTARVCKRDHDNAPLG